MSSPRSSPKTQRYPQCEGCPALRQKLRDTAKKDWPSCKHMRLCSRADMELLEQLAPISDLKVLDQAQQSIGANHAKVSGQVEAGRHPPAANADAFLTWLLERHRDVFSQAVPGIAGRFRRLDEASAFGGGVGHAGYREGAPVDEIEPRLRKLFEVMQGARGQSLSRRMARFLQRFFEIHPFLDGNGRVGRLYLVAMAQHEGFGWDPAVRSERHDRRRYLNALQYAHFWEAEVSRARFRSSPRPRPHNALRGLERWIEGHLRTEVDLENENED